jgi:hypothetical protein
MSLFQGAQNVYLHQPTITMANSIVRRVNVFTRVKSSNFLPGPQYTQH